MDLRVCGAVLPGMEFALRFTIARPLQGGSDALDNLETLCFDCNRGQRDNVV